MKTRVACAVLAGAAAIFGMQSPATAQTAAVPAEVAQAQPQARLNGRSTLRFFGLDIYEARLWAAPDFSLSRYAQQPFALELEYRRSLSGKLIAQRSMVEMRRQGDISAAQGTQWQERMEALFPDVKAGDRITGEYTPDTGARFWFNGRLLGEVRDAQFARLFFGIWLSPQTSEPQARCALAAC